MPSATRSPKRKKSSKAGLIPDDFVNPHAEANNLELPRIGRIIGQLEGVRRMIQERRHCYEVIHQIRSISSAVQSLEAKILENHIEHLLGEILESKDRASAQEKRKDLVNLIKGKLFLSNQ